MAGEDSRPEGAAGAKRPGRPAPPVIDLPAQRVEPSPSAAKPDEAAKPAQDRPAQDKPAQTESRPAGRAETTAERPTPPSASPPRRRSGILGFLAAALIGALLALAIGYGLQAGGLLPSPGLSTATTALGEARKAAADLTALSATVPDTAPLAARLDDLAQKLARLEATSVELRQGAADAEAGRSRLDSLAADIDTLRQQLAALPAAPPAAGGDAPSTPGLAALEQRIAALEGRSAVPAAPVDMQPVQDAVARLQAEVNDLTSRVDGLAGLGNRQTQMQTAALAMGFSALRTAAERGEPIGSELQMLGQLGADAKDLAALQQLADGAPTVASLQAQLPAVAEAVLAAGAATRDEGGFFSRLWGNASSLVTITPTEPVEGDSVPAILSRMQARVKAGDLAGALAERQALPEAAAAASADWAAAAGRRVDLDRAIAEVMAAPGASD